MITNKKLFFCVSISAFLIFQSLSIFGQDAARDKEIDKLFDSGYEKIFDKKYAEAIADFKKVIELDPTVSNAYFTLGRIYIESGEPDKGLAAFEKYTELYAKDDEGAFAWIAEAYLKKGETDQAIEYLSEKLGENENSSPLREKRAEAFVKNGQIDDAIEDYTHAIKYYDAPGMLYARAALYRQKGEKQSALQDLISILEKFPDYEKARFEALQLGASESDLPEKIAPKNEKPSAAAAKLFQSAFDGLMENGKDAGIYHFGKAAKADARFAAPVYYIGYIFETQVLYGSAMRNYEKAQKIDPTFLPAFYRHAGILKMNHAHAPALAKYGAILKINPRYAPAYLGRAMIYDEQSYEEEKKLLKASLEKKALLEYGKALQFDPVYADAYYNRGVLFLRNNKYDAAIKDLSDAIKFGRKDFMLGSFYSSRAEAFCKSGKKNLATADEKKAEEFDAYISEPCR